MPLGASEQIPAVETLLSASSHQAQITLHANRAALLYFTQRPTIPTPKTLSTVQTKGVTCFKTGV